MAEIITIPGYGDVRLSLKDYNDMRDKIRELEEQNKSLTDMLDHVCEENQVRVRRQIIRIRELTFNPHALGQEEIIEDKMVNMEDITKELDERIRNIEEGWKRDYGCAVADKERTTKALDQCQRQKTDLEQEVYRLKHRNWWQRLWNK